MHSLSGCITNFSVNGEPLLEGKYHLSNKEVAKIILSYHCNYGKLVSGHFIFCPFRRLSKCNFPRAHETKER